MADHNDTQLKCPSCGYNLTALTSDQCPECGEEFAIVPIDQPVYIVETEHRSFELTPVMRCPKCGHGNDAFMPRQCDACGNPFTFWQRVFGIRRKI